MKIKSNLNKTFFEELNKGNVNYCVLGKSFSKFGENHMGDIDIAISKEDIQKTNRIIFQLTRNTNFYLINTIQHEINSFHLVFLENNLNCSRFHHFDICTDYIRNCRVLLFEEFLLEDKIKIHSEKVDKFVLNNSKNFIYYLIKKICKESIN